MAKQPQDELKRAFMRGIARTVRAIDDVVVAARDTVQSQTAPKRKPKPRAKPKAKSRAKPAAKPRRAAAAKSSRTRGKASAARKRPKAKRGR